MILRPGQLLVQVIAYKWSDIPSEQDHFVIYLGDEPTEDTKIYADAGCVEIFSPFHGNVWLHTNHLKLLVEDVPKEPEKVSALKRMIAWLKHR